ncbi:MAG: LysR substrate-binding domain-containing protein [Rhodocyclaceae bacterium]|nr:LysR substrate-binding domain-containing protein [Rhodocyclaceae bacterium]
MHEALRKLPSLEPLKGFDAAVRHLSFTRAAAELFLTQSAISRQIQMLEDQLGVKLFRRETRKLTLTSEGEILHRAVVEVLERLADVCAGLRRAQRRPRVTITAAVGIASLWLVPRLAVFQELDPDLDVLISADNRIVDLEREGIDLALRYDDPETAPAGAIHLFEEIVFPVAAPAVAARLSSPLSAADIANATLLDFADDIRAPWQSWEPWLHGFNLAHVRPKAVLQFNQYDQLIRAAEDGRGIALGRGPLVMSSIAAGRLVALTETRERLAARAYFLVRGPGGRRPEVERFADWLLDEARKTKAEAYA